jgi:nucleoside-diphosphate-sugar epimerase
MTKIAILGANSQVGAEVAIYLSLHYEVDLICLIRSEYSAALLRIASIPYQTINYENLDSAQEVLAQCDLVLDFNYPQVELVDILNITRKNIEAVMRQMKVGSKYLYASSIMAFGMPSNATQVENHLIPRTSYSYIKRKAEEFTRKLGKQRKIEVFVFRLSQVHGLLQVVTQQFAKDLSFGAVQVNGQPTDLTNTVFASSIAEAVMNIVKGSLQPGSYTVVSAPQWTLQELYQYYEKYYGVQSTIQYGAQINDAASAPPLNIRGSLKGKLLSSRDLFETHVLLHLPSLFPKIKGVFRVKNVAADAHSIQRNSTQFTHNVLGAVPSAIVPNIKSSQAEVLAAHHEMEKALDGWIGKYKK